MLHLCDRVLLVCLWTGVAQAQKIGIPQTAREAKDYVEMAFKYGPFAFAVFFGGLACWLIKQAKDAASSSKPGLKDQAKLCWIFAGVAGATFIVFAAIGTHHWTKAAESAQVFKGEIKDLHAYEQVDADGFYFRNEPKPLMPGEMEALHNMHFVRIQDRAFTKGDLFEIAYFKDGAAKRTMLKLEYEGDSAPSYRIEYDDKTTSYVLRKIPTRADAAEKRGALTFPPAAYAQSLPAARMERSMGLQVARQAVQARPGVDLRLVNLLQDARTPVGAKIDVVDQLLGMDIATKKAYAEMVSDREPMALTLIDLSRHSDKELASKAALLVKQSEAESALAKQLGSPKPEVRAAAEKAVFRVGPERADRILKEAAPSSRTQTLKTKVDSRENQRVLTPVGSAGGDRYYVQANWDPKNEKTVRCLTELFNRDPLSSRSLAEEQKLMQGSSERLVSWYSRDWVLSMADKISACGARASFPAPGAKR